MFFILGQTFVGRGVRNPGTEHCPQLHRYQRSKAW